MTPGVTGEPARSRTGDPPIANPVRRPVGRRPGVYPAPCLREWVTTCAPGVGCMALLCRPAAIRISPRGLLVPLRPDDADQRELPADQGRDTPGVRQTVNCKRGVGLHLPD